MCVLFGSAGVNIVTSLISAVALDSGNVEGLVNDARDDLIGNRYIYVYRQLLEGLGDIEPWIAVDQTD